MNQTNQTEQNEQNEKVYDHYDDIISTFSMLTFEDVFKIHDYLKYVYQDCDKLTNFMDSFLEIKIADYYMSNKLPEIMEFFLSMSDEEIHDAIFMLLDEEKLKEYTAKTDSDYSNILNFVTHIKEEDKSIFVTEIIKYRNKLNDTNNNNTNGNNYNYIKNIVAVPISITGSIIGGIIGGVCGAFEGAFKGVVKGVIKGAITGRAMVKLTE